MGVDECKTIVREEKRKIIERKVRRQQQKAMFKSAVPSEDQTTAPKQQEKVKAKGTEQYKSVFDAQNLQGAPESESQTPSGSNGSGASPDVFNPSNLRKTIDAE
jgi:hypothetical protein